MEYQGHKNRHNVVYLDMSKHPDICRNYHDYISAIIEGIRADLQETYPFLKKKKYHSVSQMFWESGESFIFLIDEWDSIFYKDFMTVRIRVAICLF